MQPVQFYETTIYNREGDRRGFMFLTTPARSLIEPPGDPVQLAQSLGLRIDPDGVEPPLRIDPVDPWALPFVIDAAMGRVPDFPWRLEVWGPRERRLGAGPSAFAEYLAYAPVIPFESSPLAPRALSDLATAGGGVGAALGAYATGDPLLLLAVPAGIVVCGAARGIGDALRIGLRAKLLGLMGVEDPDDNRAA